MSEGDLIDLHVGSPIFPRPPYSPQPIDEEICDNLIDTELPILEQKLQNSTSANVTEAKRKTSVDVEDILIRIDDDDSPFARTASVRRSKSESLLSTYSDTKNHIEKYWSCENLDALEVLRSLDEVLNASLQESDRILGDECEEDAQRSIEACLLDLDNYLQSLEINGNSTESSERHSAESSERNSGDSSERQLSRRSSVSSIGAAANSVEILDSTEDTNTELRQHLQQIEANYSRFLASGSSNRGNIEEGEIYKTESATDIRRVPSCAEVHRRSLPSRSRQENVDLERLAHASGECCTGSVVVEPPKDETTTWLRTSMRRLRHFRLPSDAQPMESVRPLSAPSRLSLQRSRSRSREQNGVSLEPAGRARSSSASSRSRRPRSLSSSVSSLASTVDSSPTCTPAPTPTQPEVEQPAGATRRPCERSRQSDMPEAESPLGQWPHSLSSMMACLGCTLGLFNISRFAILTIHFGANFIFQFFIMSLVFGLPLFTLQLCLGQQLGAGVIDMWRISPLFQGVGVSLLLTQVLLGLYSIIGVSWMFVFFRDSFITKTDRYRWAEPFLYYRQDVQAPVNGTYKLSETVPDYFSGIVLQRHHLTTGNSYGTIKFQLAFNLAVVWMIVFVCLSKGLRSYGKVIYVFTLLPVFGTFVLCAKILGMMPAEYINIIFPETSWSEFFVNPKSWLAAAQEAFLTWGILGTAVMQIASHNKHKHLLQRDSSLVAVVTFTILLLTAFLANTCVQILRSYGYNYLPDSFERLSSYTFLRSIKDPLPPSLANTPVKYMVHNSFFLGEKVVRPGVDHTAESGYQALRLATELIPATFAVLGADQVSPFWAVLFYFILILFGIAQQLAIWHCVITGIMAIKAQLLKSWETTITLFSCICGFLLGLPMATEFGMFVVYFMDYTVGGIWWMVIIILLQIMAVFMVRGRPYSGDTVVTAMFTSSNHPCILSWAPALLSFTWNVILPVVLMVVCITTFKNGNFRDMFIWHHAPVAEYWPLWSRQVGSMLQLIPILLIPLIAVIQSYRYLNNGPNDILERIQLLYRPPLGEHMTDLAVHEAAIANSVSATTPANVTTATPTEDPPPKYTPPPSYTTATGARIAKFLRQSIRRSVRRLANVLGESSTSRREAMPPQPPPPDYNAVLVEMSQSNSNSTDVTIAMSDCGTVNNTPSHSGTRISTLERLRNIQPTPGSPTITAAEVAAILRSSFRRSTVRRNGTFNDDSVVSLSAENLVDSAAPIGETSLVLEHLPHSETDDFKTESNSSVI